MKRRCASLWAVAYLACAWAPAAHGATVFSLVDTGELFASSDQGTTWQVRATLPVSDAVALVARATSAELYMATRHGVVYRSSDSGTTWTSVGVIAAPDVCEMTVRPDGALLVLTATGTVWISVDGGQSFAALAALAGSDFVAMTVGPIVGRPWGGSYRLHALTRTGVVYESSNAGTTWAVKSVLATSNAVEVRCLGANLYVLDTTGVVWRSADAATTWTAVGTLSQVGMSAMTRDAQRLVVSTREGEVATSTDGTTWTWRGTTNQLAVTALGVDTPQATDVEEARGPGLHLAMSAPWPNPRRGEGGAFFSFVLPGAETVRLELYDARGRLVARREPQVFQEAGSHAIAWEPARLAAGTYFPRLVTRSGSVSSPKWIVLR